MSRLCCAAKHHDPLKANKRAINANRYKLIRKIKISTASEHDTLHFEEVADPANTSRDIYADKGYVDGEREARMKEQGWHAHPAQGHEGQSVVRSTGAPQSAHRQAARVEHVFGGLERLGGIILC